MGSQRFENGLLPRCVVVGLGPHACKVGFALGKKLGLIDNGLHIGNGELGLALLLLLEDKVVVAAHELEADQLGEVGLASGQFPDAIEGIVVVVEGEVAAGVGQQGLHGGPLKEIDFDRDDAGKEGLKVVGGHFFEGVETGKGKAYLGAVLNQASQVGHEAGFELAPVDQFFNFLEFVEGDDQPFALGEGVGGAAQKAIEGAIGAGFHLRIAGRGNG